MVESDGCVQEKQWGSPEAEQLMELTFRTPSNGDPRIF